MFVILMINKNKDGGGLCVNQEDKLFLSLHFAVGYI